VFTQAGDAGPRYFPVVDAGALQMSQRAQGPEFRSPFPARGEGALCLAEDCVGQPIVEALRVRCQTREHLGRHQALFESSPFAMPPPACRCTEAHLECLRHNLGLLRGNTSAMAVLMETVHNAQT